MSQKSFNFSDVNEEIRKLCLQLTPDFLTMRDQLECVSQGFYEFIENELTAIYLCLQNQSIIDTKQKIMLFQRAKIVQAIKTSLQFQIMLLTEKKENNLPLPLVGGN